MMVGGESLTERSSKSKCFPTLTHKQATKEEDVEGPQGGNRNSPCGKIRQIPKKQSSVSEQSIAKLGRSDGNGNSSKEWSDSRCLVMLTKHAVGHYGRPDNGDYNQPKTPERSGEAEDGMNS